MAMTKKPAKPVAAPVVAPAAVAAPAAAPAPVVAPAAVTAPAAAPAVAAKAAAPFAPAAFEMPDLLKSFSQTPETLRLNAEKGIEQARAQFAAIKENAETVAGNLEESFVAAQNGIRVFNGKMVDVFRSQVDASFAHMSALFNATSLSEAISLQQSFVKAQMEALKTHSQDLADYATQIAGQVSEPVKNVVVLPFKAA